MSENLSVKKRIVKIQNELRVNKDGKNSFYDYFKPDDILVALNPFFEQYNLIAIFDLISKNEKTYDAILTIEDTESENKVTYHLDIDKATVKNANEAQNSGATITYAKRYSLMNAFNIAINSDDPDAKKKNKTTQPGNQGQNTKDSNKKIVSDMITVFSNDLKVTKEQIEKYINKKVETLNDADINKLRTTYQDIKSGKSKKEEIFK